MSGGSETQEQTWAGLMTAAQDGDAAAYDTLLRQIVPFVRAYARRRVSAESVEDVVQEVLLCVHRVRHTYDPRRPFTPWLAAIVSRRCIDALRRRGRITAHETSDEAAYETYSDAAANHPLEQHAAAQLLGRWLNELPAGQRQALELLKLQQLSLAEASAVSGQSVGALKVSVHRALKTLRARLTGRTPDDTP